MVYIASYIRYFTKIRYLRKNSRIFYVMVIFLIYRILFMYHIITGIALYFGRKVSFLIWKLVMSLSVKYLKAAKRICYHY